MARLKKASEIIRSRVKTSKASDLLTKENIILPADGRDGLNGKDGRDGKDGINGKDGLNGKDGVNGKDGLNGRDGVDGKDGRDGKDGESFNWRGDWKQDTAYTKNDVVYFWGSSYVCLKDTKDSPSYSTTSWDKMAAAGAPGAKGAPGKDADVEKSPSFTYSSGNLSRVDYESGNFKTFTYLDSGLLNTLTYDKNGSIVTKTFYWNEDGTLNRIEEA